MSKGHNFTQGIYKITNKQNNKIYIGSSNNIFTRWGQHCDLLVKNKHHNGGLQYDYNCIKDISVFNFEIIEMTHKLSKDELFILEGKSILTNKSYEKEIGYNKVINKYNDIKLNQTNIIEDNQDINIDRHIFSYIETLDNNKLLKLKDIKLLNINDVISNYKYEEWIKDKFFLSKSWIAKDENRKIRLKNMIQNVSLNILKTKSNEVVWTTFEEHVDSLKAKGYIKGFSSLSGNSNVKNYSKSKYYMYIANVFLNNFEYPDIANNTYNQELFALNMIIKWIIVNVNFNNETILFIPSMRMYNILNKFIEGIDANGTKIK